MIRVRVRSRGRRVTREGRRSHEMVHGSAPTVKRAHEVEQQVCALRMAGKLGPADRLSSSTVRVDVKKLGRLRDGAACGCTAPTASNGACRYGPRSDSTQGLPDGPLRRRSRRSPAHAPRQRSNQSGAPHFHQMNQSWSLSVRQVSGEDAIMVERRLHADLSRMVVFDGNDRLGYEQRQQRRTGAMMPRCRCRAASRQQSQVPGRLSVEIVTPASTTPPREATLRRVTCPTRTRGLRSRG